MIMSRVLPSDTSLRAGTTYIVTVHFQSALSDVGLRMLVSDLAAAVLARVAADPVTATRVAWLSTEVRDDAVGPNTHEAVMRVRVVEEDPNLRIATLERMFTGGFTAGTGDPRFPGVPVWRVSVTVDTGLSRSVAFALGAVVVFGALYMLTRRRGTGMAKVRGRRLDPSLAETKLERVALKWLNETGKDYDDGAQGAFRELMQGGCQSGIVGDLIYHKDTIPFFKRHKADIAVILRGMMRDSGVRDPKDLFGDKWDEDDPFVEEDTNQNLLAWFGFEEAARNVALRAGFED